MQNLWTALKFGSLATGASLLLSSCAAIIPMADPLGTCGTETNVSIAVSNNKPDVDVDFVEVDAEGDPLVVTLTGEDINLSLTGNRAFLEVEYRIGIFDENGLPAVDNSFLDTEYVPVSPAPPAFLDVVPYEAGEFSLPIDFSSGAQQSGSFSDLLLGTDYDLDFFYNEDALLLLTFPGAFVVTCNSGAGQANDGEFVAAVQMFPNILTFEGDPAFQLTDSDADATFDNSELYLGPEFAGDSVAILGKPTTDYVILSSDPATDRWLQMYSRPDVTPVSNLVGEGSGPIQVDTEGFLNVGVEDVNFQPGITYNLILFIIAEEVFNSESPITPGVYQSPFRTAIFDLAINSSGVGEFTPFVAEPPSRPSRPRAPVITDIRDSVEVSTKGNREIKVTGNRLNNVLAAKLGTTPASIVSAEDSILTLRLPKLATGTYDLTLSYQNGETVRPNFLKYVSSSKIEQIAIPKSQKRAAWSLRMANLLRTNLGTVQVDCVARVPAGTKAAPVKKKASAICASIENSSIKTRVVVKKAPASSSSAVAVKFWD